MLWIFFWIFSLRQKQRLQTIACGFDNCFPLHDSPNLLFDFSLQGHILKLTVFGGLLDSLKKSDVLPGIGRTKILLILIYFYNLTHISPWSAVWCLLPSTMVAIEKIFCLKNIRFSTKTILLLALQFLMAQV